jgi:hypothetical protein
MSPQAKPIGGINAANKKYGIRIVDPDWKDEGYFLKTK